MYQSVFISGVSGQLGLSLAQRLITQSLVKNLYVQVRSDRHNSILTALANRHQVNLHIASFDIRDNTKLKAFLEKALEHTGQILVIANAGISLSRESEHFLEDDFEIERAFDVNTKGTVKTLYYALDLFLQKISYTGIKNDAQSCYCYKNTDRSIHLVAVSSLASLLPLRSSPLYSASKAAVNYYLRALNASVPKQLHSVIKTTLVLPGFISTDMSRRFIGSKSGMVSSDRAAELILNALRAHKKVFAFPFYLYLGIKLSYLVPDFILRYIMRAFDFSVQKDREREEFDKSGSRFCAQDTDSKHKG